MASYKDAENYRWSGKFPALAQHPMDRTSDPTRNYNCYAYAAGDTRRPWCCLPILPRGVYWPPGFERKEDDLWSVILGYAAIGYDFCDNGTLEPGIEKIVIYVNDNDVPQHAAIQRENGEWQSKLGDDIDVSHSLESFGGGGYGEAKYFMSRQRKLSCGNP